MAAPAMSARELLERLRRHYLKPGPLPGGIFLPEVGWNGATGSRVDAVYVGFTSTSGRILVGHEVKVSRSDWRHELDQPGKADPWHDQCHAWYVVAPSTDIVPAEEVPEGWGLMVVNARTMTRLDVKIKAKVRPHHTPSWNAVRSIMARQDTLRAESIEAYRREALDKARAEVEQRERERLNERAAAHGRREAEIVAAIERELGCSFSDWSHDQHVTPETFTDALLIARARRALVDRWGGIDGALLNLDRARENLAALGKALSEVRS